MACRLFGAKPLSKPILDYCQLDPKEQISVKFKVNTFMKHASENIVCETADILPRGGVEYGSNIALIRYVLGQERNAIHSTILPIYMYFEFDQLLLMI